MRKGFWRKNEGLTLVELIVSMAIGTMIFAATTTVLLLGFRIHARTTESITQQYTARTVMTMLEDLAANGTIDDIERRSNGSWIVRDKNDQILLSYDGLEQIIYTGAYPVTGSDDQTGTPILENVVASYVLLKDDLLTISLEDPDRTYTSSVYYRARKDGQVNNDFKPEDKEDQIANSTIVQDYSQERKTLLTILNSQAGSYGGIINHDTRPCDTSTKICGKQLCHNFTFFSQWYVNGYEDNPGWSAETPWCGCFVSWGLSHIDSLEKQGTNDRWFANVDDFMAYFTRNTNKATCWKSAGATPVAGDLIFFNMISDERDNPSHMGVVLSVNTRDGIVTTIEGNSADMVAVREYPLDDSRILGYGDPWAAQKTPQSGQ